MSDLCAPSCPLCPLWFNLSHLKARARRLKHETVALYLAARHPATPWYAKLVVAIVVAYAFSPIDLIPDFIPVLGLLDDLLLVPAGVWLALRLALVVALWLGIALWAWSSLS